MPERPKLEKRLFEILLIHFRFAYYRKQQSKLVNWISQQFFADYEKKQKGFFLTKPENKKLLIVNCSAPTKSFIGKRSFKINHDNNEILIFIVGNNFYLHKQLSLVQWAVASIMYQFNYLWNFIYNCNWSATD